MWGVAQARRAQPARRASGSRSPRDPFFDLPPVIMTDAAQLRPISGGRWALFRLYSRVSDGRGTSRVAGEL